MNRLVVGTPEHEIEAPVGVLFWSCNGGMLTVITKITWTWMEDGSLKPAEEQLPLRAPEDFIPGKVGTDVLLSGAAYAHGAPADRLAAEIRGPGFERKFLVVAATPASELPLGSSGLYEPDGLNALDGVGALPHDDIPELPRHADMAELARYNVASPAQRATRLRPLDEIELFGLTPAGRETIALPVLKPWVLAFRARINQASAMVLDTMQIDTTSRQVVTTYRSRFDAKKYTPPVEWLGLELNDSGGRPNWDAFSPELSRGRFFYASQRDHLDTAPRPDTGEQEHLDGIRMSSMGTERAPEPRLTLEKYAVLSAELAEKREPREEVLERNGFDEQTWLVEERGWLERMGDAAMAGDGTLAARYGELYEEAMDKNAVPAEQEWSFHDYLGVLADLEIEENPLEYLEKRGLTMPAWMRIARRWSDECKTDPVARNVRDTFLAEARAKRQETAR